MKRICQLYQKGCLALLIIGLCVFAIPLLFKYSCYGILTGSMEPTLPVGSLVYVQTDTNQEYALNDIITFHRAGKIYTHRIVGIDNQQHLLTTKGDANQLNDEAKIAITQVIGKVMYSLPWLGYILLYFKSVEGIVLGTLMISLFILSFLIPMFVKGDQQK